MHTLTFALDGKSTCKHGELPTYSTCIDDYIGRQIGCKVPWISDNSTSYKSCSSPDQTLAYLNVSRKIASMKDAAVAAETGCYIPCRRNEYTTKWVKYYKNNQLIFHKNVPTR